MNGTSRASAVELSVVMPGYNEERTIERTVSSWIEVLRQQDVPFEFLAYNDGSTDTTGERLRSLGRNFPELTVRFQSNRGHGPTILRGYNESSGAWVLQIDSDGEVAADSFPRFWDRREGFDFLIGRRLNRDAGWGRNLISRLEALSILALCGRSVGDANCPCRLMRREFLDSYLRLIPESAFAPNVVMTGCALRDRWRVTEVPVEWVAQASGLKVNRHLLLNCFRTLRLLIQSRRWERSGR